MTGRAIGQQVRFGAWIFILLTLLMSFASIWIFSRITPTTATILEENDRSLASCEAMLAALAKDNLDDFDAALSQAEANITEKGENTVIDTIKEARHSRRLNRYKIISAIEDLASINRSAMEQADRMVQQFGTAGAWGVVFMAAITFFTGMIFMRSMRRNLIDPLLEIDAVTRAQAAGETMRRCYLKTPSQEIQQMFQRMNTMLDQGEKK